MDPLGFVLEDGEAWLQYAARKTMLKESEESLASLRLQALADPKIKAYLNDVTDYHSIKVTNHKNPDLPIHKLLFLLDIGLGDAPEIGEATAQIMAHKDGNGVYRSLTNIPTHFGGSGEDVLGWCLCDAPLLLLALLKAGVDYETHIKQGADYLAGLHREGGYTCTSSEEFGKFRGPGRKDDCCPNASLIMLKLLVAIPEYRDCAITEDTANGLLALWENSRERHPYQFYMGTDFRKLKAPTLWYDILSVVEALSYVEAVTSDARFLEMLALIRGKQDEDGRFTPESVYQKCKAWDFGQKKVPSPYLTYVCYRIFARLQALE